MRNIKIVGFLFAIFILSMACENKENKKETSIVVELQGFTDLEGEYLYLTENLSYVKLDSALIKTNQKIQFNEIDTTASMYALVAYSAGRPWPLVDFFAGKKDLNIVVENKLKYKNRRNLISTIKGGGKEQLAYNNFQKNLNPLLKAQEEFNEKWAKMVAEGKHLDSVLRAPMDSLSKLNFENMKDYYKSYIDNNDNLTSLYILNTTLRFAHTAKELDSILNQFNAKYENNFLLKKIKEKSDIMKNIAIGAIAPDFTKPDVNGDPVSLSSFRGNYVLLDFWASWCGPCRKENPFVKKAYEKYNKLGFEVLGVSYDFPGDRDKWLKAIEADELTWTQVSDLAGWDDPTTKLYNISGIPSPFLIDPEGRIVAKHYDLREEKLLAILDSIYGQRK